MFFVLLGFGRGVGVLLEGGDLAIGVEVADDGVLGEEVEVVLLFFWVFEVVAEVS